MKGLLQFLAVAFAVVALDLLDQNKSAGALFFATATAVVLILIFSKHKK